MAYRDLEDRLEQEGTLQDFHVLLDGIKGDAKFQKAFQFLVTLASDLEQQGIHEYMFIGGYGVLLQMVSLLGARSIKRWRGSYDIDVVAKDYDFDSLLQREYLVQKHQSHLTLFLENYALDDSLWQKRDLIRLYGITFPTLCLPELLKMKLEVQPREELPRMRDRIDIVHMLAVFERRGQLAISQTNLTDFQRQRLYRILRIPEADIERMDLFIEPSRAYLQRLRESLKR